MPKHRFSKKTTTHRDVDVFDRYFTEGGTFDQRVDVLSTEKNKDKLTNFIVSTSVFLLSKNSSTNTIHPYVFAGLYVKKLVTTEVQIHGESISLDGGRVGLLHLRKDRLGLIEQLERLQYSDGLLVGCTFSIDNSMDIGMRRQLEEHGAMYVGVEDVKVFDHLLVNHGAAALVVSNMIRFCVNTASVGFARNRAVVHGLFTATDHFGVEDVKVFDHLLVNHGAAALVVSNMIRFCVNTASVGFARNRAVVHGLFTATDHFDNHGLITITAEKYIDVALIVELLQKDALEKAQKNAPGKPKIGIIMHSKSKIMNERLFACAKFLVSSGYEVIAYHQRTMLDYDDFLSISRIDGTGWARDEAYDLDYARESGCSIFLLPFGLIPANEFPRWTISVEQFEERAIEIVNTANDDVPFLPTIQNVYRVFMRAESVEIRSLEYARHTKLDRFHLKPIERKSTKDESGVSGSGSTERASRPTTRRSTTRPPSRNILERPTNRSTSSFLSNETRSMLGVGRTVVREDPPPPQRPQVEVPRQLPLIGGSMTRLPPLPKKSQDEGQGSKSPDRD